MGFLGLVAVAALLAVYLFRPQYRKKVISGTVVWKRVLLHGKKQRPAFDHILLFVLQALVLAAFAAGLAQPVLYSRQVLLEDAEYVLVIDSSASMRAGLPAGGGTRFERAVDGARREVDALFSEADKGSVSLIVADDDPGYLFSDLKKSDRAEIDGALGSLACGLTEGNLERAIQLAGERLGQNPYAKIFVYTDSKLGNLGTAVEVVDVSDESAEKNVAVLGCAVGMQDNQYYFEITLGAYGDITARRNVSIDIRGADNGTTRRDIHLDVPVSFAVDQNSPSRSQTVRLTVTATDTEYGGQADWFFDSYDEMEIYIPDLNDSIPDDDRYFVYGGIRDVINVEYWSMTPKIFWQYGFVNLANNMRSTRNIFFSEIYRDQGMKARNSGFDVYIFEHSVPPEILEAGMPKDGIILLADPDGTVSEALPGVALGETVSLGALTPCTGGGHPLLNYMDPSKIGVTEYKKLVIEDGGQLEPILFANGDPVMLVKNTPSSKFVVMPFSINMSDFYGEQFQIFLYNLINYFLPPTLQKNDFEIGERTSLDCKGESLEVSLGEQTETFGVFPAEYTFRSAGTYVFTAKSGLEKGDEVRKAYAHPPVSESNLFYAPDFRLTLNNSSLSGENGEDIFVWFAAAALILMAAEWAIQYKYIL